MTDALERKKKAIKALASSSTSPGEVAACEAALVRLGTGNEGTRNVVRAKAEQHAIPADPFGPRTKAKQSGPRPARPLLDHNRQAWLALVAGGGRLSRTENSFLHRMRESLYISPAQQRWLDDIDTRLRWEASL